MLFTESWERVFANRQPDSPVPFRDGWENGSCSFHPNHLDGAAWSCLGFKLAGIIGCDGSVVWSWTRADAAHSRARWRAATAEALSLYLPDNTRTFPALERSLNSKAPRLGSTNSNVPAMFLPSSGGTVGLLMGSGAGAGPVLELRSGRLWLSASVTKSNPSAGAWEWERTSGNSREVSPSAGASLWTLLSSVVSGVANVCTPFLRTVLSVFAANIRDDRRASTRRGLQWPGPDNMHCVATTNEQVSPCHHEQETADPDDDV